MSLPSFSAADFDPGVIRDQVMDFEGYALRFVPSYYADDPLGVGGSLVGGGRFNYSELDAELLGVKPIGALYTSVYTRAAFDEAIGDVPSILPSRVAYTVDVRLDRVLNLANIDTCEALGIAYEHLLLDWRAELPNAWATPPQSIGHALAEHHVHALLSLSVASLRAEVRLVKDVYPHATVADVLKHNRPSPDNLTIFPRNLDGDSRITVIDRVPAADLRSKLVMFPMPPTTRP